MEPRKFKQFIEQAARLPQRQRADLTDLLDRSSLQEKTAAMIAGPLRRTVSARAAARCACTAVAMPTDYSATAVSTAPALSMH